MKQLGKKLSAYLLSPFTVGLVVTLLITYGSVDYYSKRETIYGKAGRSFASLVQEMHEKSIDWRLLDRGLAPGSDRVGILAIDEDAVNLEGRWPWPREKIAKLVDRTLYYGAKSISFDIIFPEEDGNSALPALERVRHALKAKKSDPSLTNLNSVQRESLESILSNEAASADSDRVLSSSIKASADHLVMGTFFDGADLETSPHMDLCLDARFDRSYESRYWKTDVDPLIVKDVPLSQLVYPKDLKSHLADYFMTLETSAAATWFEKHTDLSERIKAAIEELSELLPIETYPGLAVLAVNNDFENGKAILEQINPSFGQIEAVRAVFRRFLSAFEKKEFASLSQTLRNSSLGYCTRFLSKDDELLFEAKYKELWGDSPEAKEQFAVMSWASLFGAQDPKLKNDPKALGAVIDKLKSQSMVNLIPQVLKWTVNIPVMADSTKHSGYFNAIQDTDGSVRRSRLVTRLGNFYAPSLAFKTFLLDQGYRARLNVDADDKIRTLTTSKDLRSLEVLDADAKPVMKIPVDRRGNLMVNYAGPSQMFPHVGASEMFSDEPMMNISWRQLDPTTHRWVLRAKTKVDKKEFLKDKLLILGATAVGVYDLRVTPFDENFPGVETHANVLSNLLVELARIKGQPTNSASPGFLRAADGEENVMWVILLVTGLVLTGLLTYFGSVSGLAITGVAILGVYAIDKYLLFRSGIVVTIAFPVFLIVTTFVALTFYKYFTEERTKRALKGTFEKYVSPSIVAEILSDPENIELGGKKMELTVMFSDVRGFTTISEKLDPRALSDLLNSYLTPMTNLVFKHKGTLDKYMGDAIMAFWGAPLHFADHAQHACRSALEMIVKLRELQAEYRAKGLPEIDIGIGLNTGEMSVGNMGSDTVRSYTVMGDAVNLGSRLEGINKQYGTRIIISEFTRQAIGDAFTCREVDWVKVKGKAQPVRIFELVSEGAASPEQTEVLKHFGEGFSLYHERKFETAIESLKRALAVNADDAVSQLYLERCEDYLVTPPPEDWDGVFTMTSK